MQAEGAPPPARECALLLRLLEVKEQERKAKSRNATEGKDGKVSRLRIAEVSLRRLWLRRRISAEFVEEVAEWLSGADWSLFFAGTTYTKSR